MNSEQTSHIRSQKEFFNKQGQKSLSCVGINIDIRTERNTVMNMMDGQP